jgi:phosphoribosylanthranilate isomerase
MHTLVKICGVTTAEDAALAAAAGADLVGFVLHPAARRGVDEEAAFSIVRAARAGGAEPVAVVVEQDAGAIKVLAARLALAVVQLHGATACNARGELPAELGRIVGVDVATDGTVRVPAGIDSQRDLLLCDSPGGGSGVRLDWERFRPPAGIGWFLAGGLDPDNVTAALRLAPSGVDVSSGVCGSDVRRKDAARVRAFVEKVRTWDARHA